MPTISGGSAALHGFLYQLLAHLDWAVKLTIAPNGDDHDLVLEPVDGSDAEVVVPGRRLIEQYKTRRDGTWSVRDIVTGPIADFVRTANTWRSPSDEFRFVTDGSVEHQRIFKGLLSRISDCAKQGVALDSDVRRKYRSQGDKTDIEMFEWIRREIASALRLEQLPSRDIVIHVLSRIQLVDCIQEEAMRLGVEDFLRRSLPNPDEASEKTSALIGALIERLAQGPVSVNAKKFLDELGVDPTRSGRLAELNNRLHAILAQGTMRGSHTYRPSHDVRDAPPWDIASRQILALVGAPGTGKSWQLLRLGHALGERGLPCVYAPLLVDVSRTLDTAARIVWNEALGTPTTCDIASLKQALIRAQRLTEGVPWLVILIDGPIDDSGLQQLVDFAANDPDIRFVITAFPDLGQRLHARPSSMVQVVEVRAFDHDELCNYLELHNLPWADLPFDLFSLLKLPLLASLYVRSSPDFFARSPYSEYELFEALWNRVGERVAGAIAAGHLRTLARNFAEKSGAISLAIEHVLPHASESTLRALIQAGWLDLDRNAHVRFAHDRLLNWALADAVVTDVQAGRLTIEQLPAALMLPWGEPTRWGYVPMDVLWKLCADDSGSAHAAKLLMLLRGDVLGIPEHALYEDLLPTLGTRAIRLLAALLNERGAEQLAPRLLQCVREVGRQRRTSGDHAVVEASVRSWLGASERIALRLALTLVEAGGLSSLADDVFRVHLVHAMSLRSTDPKHSDYELSFAALKSCVRENPAWLDQAIAKANHSATLDALSWQLLNLEADVAWEIWQRSNSRFVEHAAPDFLRGTLACIRRFRDTTFIEFVRNALASSTDFEAGSALMALAVIAPDSALDVVESGYRSEFRYVRSSWFAPLHQARPAESEDWLLRHFDDGASHELFEIVEPDASTGLIDSVISAFRRAVAARLTSDNPWLHRWKGLLSKMRTREVVWSLASTDTERALVEIAARRVDPARTWHDHLLGDAREVLIAIGGPGLQTLLGKELAATRGRAALNALRLLPMVPWSDVAADLEKHVSLASQAADEDSQISTYEAIVALAALDCHEVLVAVIRRTDPHRCPLEALELRQGATPFSEDLVASIAENLARTDTSEDECLRELLLAALAQAPQLIGAVEHVLLDASITQRAFIYAAQAFRALGGEVSEPIARASERWLADEKASIHAIRLLFRSDSSESRRVLLEFGRTKLDTDPGIAGEIAIRLPEEGADAPAATQLAIDAFHRLDMATTTYDRVVRLGGPKERSLLRQRAFRTIEGGMDLRRQAIRAWHHVDPVEAVDAALWALEQGDSLDPFATSFVMRRGSDDQCVRLLDLIGDLGRDVLWYHAGRSLRQRSEHSAQALIEHYRVDVSLAARRVFAHMAGWLVDRYAPEVRARSQTEHSPVVLKALERTGARINQLSTLQDHLNTLRSAQGTQRLSALHACLSMGEPFLLDNKSDALWIGHALMDHPPYFRRFAERELESLRKAWKPPT